MYYGHMSKQEILHSSLPFLQNVYRMYGKRACENLGVSPDKNKDSDSATVNDAEPSIQYDNNGYPVQFKKLTAKERKEAVAEYSSIEDFMKEFQ